MKIKKIIAVLMVGALSVSTLLCGCGSKIDDAKTVVSIDGEDVSLGYANFVARFQQANYDAFYRSYFGDDYWTKDMSGTGEDMETSVKTEILKNIEQMYLLEDHMGDYGVTVSDDEKAKITETAKQFLADNSKDAIEQVGATQDYIERMLYLTLVQNKMQKAIYAEVDPEVSDEDAARKTVSYFTVETQVYYDEDGTAHTYEDDQITEQKQKAEEAATEAKNDFDTVATLNGGEVKTASFGKDDNGGLPDDVVAAADGLSDGEVSDLIDVNGTCYVVRMDSTFDEEATATAKESILSTRQSEHFTEVLNGYMEAAKIDEDEDAWAQVKFDSLFNVISNEEDTTTQDSSAQAESDSAAETSAPAE